MRILAALFPLHLPCHAIGFACGVKIGEVTDTSAVLWTRLTENGQAKNRVDEWKADAPNWTVPGMEGMVELSNWQTGKELKRTLVATLKATAENDFCVQKTVTGLKPATRYSFRVRPIQTDSVLMSGALWISTVWTFP